LAPTPEQTIFLRNEGNFTKFGLFSSNFPSTIVTSALNRDRPPFEELATVTNSNEAVKEEKWRRDASHVQIEEEGVRISVSPFFSPSKKQNWKDKEDEEVREITLP
jgi:hypothetical protein